MNKKLFITSILTLTLLIGYSSTVQAEETQRPWHEQMVATMADKLGLSEDSVDSAFTETREQYRAEHQLTQRVGFEDRLQTLVDEGKLTESQREAWLDKHEEHMAEREANRTAHHEEMQTWFAQQGIDSDLMGPMGQGKGAGGGRGMGMHRSE